MTSIYNPQQLEADENTYISALDFTDGKVIATRNDGVTLETSDLDDRYIQTDIYLDSASFNSGTRVLTLTLTDASTVTVTVPADYVNAASFDVSDGILELTRTDGGTVSVDLDGRYVQTADDIYLSGVAWDQNTGDVTYSRNNSTNIVENIDGRYVPFKYTVGVVTDLDDLVTTQVQVCDKSASNRPTASSASMDNFSVLVIQAGSGGSQLCIASDADSSDNQAWIRMWKENLGVYTFTAWSEFSTSITGNFVPFNLTIPSSAYALNDYTTTGIFSVDKNATNLPTDMPSWSDKLILQVYQSGASNGTQLLYTASGTTSVQIGRIYFRMWTDAAGITWSAWRKVATENEYMPLHLVEPAFYNGDVDLLKDSGLYTVNSSSTNLPSPLHTNSITIEVIKVFQSGSSAALGIRQICRQNTYSGLLSKIQQNRTYERGYTSTGVWGEWRMVTTGGITGDLENAYAAVDITGAPYETMTGMWGLGAKGAATTWPKELPATSDYNILETIRTGDYGAGQQKIMCADYDSGTEPDTHIREWKRVFDTSATTEWYEYQFQGQPIFKQVYHTTLYLSATHGNNPDTSNTAAYYVTLGGDSMYVYGFSGGYAEGQTVRILRETSTVGVVVTIYNNLTYYADQRILLMDGASALTLTTYQSAEFIFHNDIWFQYK